VFGILGDRVAVAIMQVVEVNKPIDDLTLKKILVAVSTAFEFPAGIEAVQDRQPTATLTLLHELESRLPPADQHRIQQIRSAVINAVQSAGGTKA
jgi:hypothetical protein